MKTLIYLCSALLGTPQPPAKVAAPTAMVAPVQLAEADANPKDAKTKPKDAGAAGKASKAKDEKAPTTAKAEATPEAAVLERVQKFYEQTKDLQASFVQRYTRVALSKTSESKGELRLKKPGMMRWDYKTPVEKHFITDGAKLFVYEPEEEQVIVDKNFKSSALSSSLAFLFGQGRLEDSFHAKLLPTKDLNTKAGFDVLELVPKNDATYAKLVLVVDPKTGQVAESILFETSGNLNRFEFIDTKTNTGVADKEFSFVPPPNVEVVMQ